MRYRYFIAALVAIFLANSSGAADAAWMLRYAGHSTNELIWDPRTEQTYIALLPRSMVDSISKNLGGPPEPVYVEGRKVILSACRGHDCGNMGFLWVDSEAGTALGATAACFSGLDRPSGHHWKDCELTLGSLAFSDQSIPDSARRALLAWIAERDLEVAKAHFLDRNNISHPLAAETFSTPVPFRPPAKGPGFDCAKAESDIELTICADATLARLDLELSSLYEQVRGGVSTVPARNEVRDLQRRWLEHRQLACLNSAVQPVCLANQYRHQIDVLNNWIPSRKESP